MLILLLPTSGLFGKNPDWIAPCLLSSCIEIYSLGPRECGIWFKMSGVSLLKKCCLGGEN